MYSKCVCTYFVDLEIAYYTVSRETLWGVLREYVVDSCLLLADKWLYSCSEVCVRVSEVKSQPFTVGVGLRQGCKLSPLLFIVYIHWIDSNSWVNESCRTNRVLFVDDLMLLGSSEQVFNRFFLLHVTKWEWKLALKWPRYYVSLETQGSACCKWATIPCSMWKSSNTLGWYSRVTEDGTRRFMHRLGSKRSSAWALSLCGHKTWAIKHRKAVTFQTCLCSHPHLWPWILGNYWPKCQLEGLWVLGCFNTAVPKLFWARPKSEFGELLPNQASNSLC